jgi:hypothetical protein
VAQPSFDDDQPTLEWPPTSDRGTLGQQEPAQLLAAVAEDALDVLVDCEQAERLADARALLAEQAHQDGEIVSDGELDRRAAQVCLEDRRERFAAELVTRIVPDQVTLAQAWELDDHALELQVGVATSLAEEFPPSLSHLRSELLEELRAEQRTQASLARQLAALSVRRSRWRRSPSSAASAPLAGEQARVQAQLGVCAERLASLGAELAALGRREEERVGWFQDTRDILARGVAAMRVLEARRRKAADEQGGPARPAAGGRAGLRVVS